MSDRPAQALVAALAATVAALGALWPLRGAWTTGGLPGAGPDVVSTTWAAWWLSQVGPAGLVGAQTDLANFPHGATGVVLSPLTTGAQAAGMAWLGVEAAATTVGALHTLAFAAAVGLLAHAAGARGPAAVVAGCAMLVGRILPFGMGEGSLVAVAGLPIPLGLAALLRLRETGGAALAVVAAACAGWAAMENPYLGPVLPGAAVALAASRRRQSSRWTLLATGLAGAAAVLAGAALFSGAASPDYPRELDGAQMAWGRWRFTVVDLPWARVHPWELLWGGPVRWTLGSDAAVQASGGRTLGWSVLALAVVGGVRRPRAALPWLALAGGMVVLAAGSVQGGVGLPFLFVNGVLDAIARPLTQPVRFLVVALIGVAVAAGHGVEALRAWRHAPAAALAAFAVESAVMGAGSLQLPVTPVPEAICATDLAALAATHAVPDGAALTWPWDARDDEPVESQLLQLRHGRPGAHRGVASWALRDRSALVQLRALGVRPQKRHGMPLEAEALRSLGYAWMLVAPGADPVGAAFVQDALGPPLARCDGLAVFSLGGAGVR